MRMSILFFFFRWSLYLVPYRNEFYIENSQSNSDKTQANKSIGIPLAKMADSIISNADSVSGEYTIMIIQ
jgi:hypothetical protein